MLSNRKLTLFQRATYINACMLSKIWYVAHIYPLNLSFTKEINKIIFNYLWNGGYEPVRRATVFRPRTEEGLGIIDCFIKCQVIFLNSFIKCIINESYFNSHMYYYCFIRMQNIVHMEYSVHNASLSTTPYYEAVYSIIKKVIHMPGFPNNTKEKYLYAHAAQGEYI